MKAYCKIILLLAVVLTSLKTFADPVIYINQVAFNAGAPKDALIGDDKVYAGKVTFTIVSKATHGTMYTGMLGPKQQINEWAPGKYFYNADFSSFNQTGDFQLCIKVEGKEYYSDPFYIGSNALAELTIPSVIHYYHKQRANTPTELSVDSHVKLFGSDKTVDMHGGWCDASGDVSKYFSHLAYANFMSPQQTPLVTWARLNADEAMPDLLNKMGVRDSLQSEALWGADYMTRALSDSSYFY